MNRYTPLKYKTAFFFVNPSGIIQLCREPGNHTWALEALEDLGVSDPLMKEDILKGHIDIIKEADETLTVIDHRVTARVLNRLKGDEE